MLRNLQVYFGGTCIPRKGMPKDILYKECKAVKFFKRGDAVWRHTREMSFVSW